MSEWQCITTAPKDGQRVILAERDFVSAGRFRNGFEGPALYYDGDSFRASATHWMPLPPPPKTPEGK